MKKTITIISTVIIAIAGIFGSIFIFNKRKK